MRTSFTSTAQCSWQTGCTGSVITGVHSGKTPYGDTSLIDHLQDSLFIHAMALVASPLAFDAMIGLTLTD